MRVFAAASLAEAFSVIEPRFEAAHPGIDLQVDVGASSTLRAQILEGAPADVFAPADVADMEILLDAGAVDGTPSVLARNRLVLATPAGNSAGVDSIDDLADPSLLVGLCAEQVPCGRLARRTLAAAGVEPSVDTDEPDVRSLATKLAAGELDAGIVYRTDAVASDHIDSLDLADGLPAELVHLIAVLDAAPNPGGAASLVEFALSSDGQQLLRELGFEAR